MFVIAFWSALVLTCIHVARKGDYRDMAAAMVLVLQAGGVAIFSGNFPVAMTIYMVAIFSFVWFSIRLTGVVLGVLSGVMANLALAAWLGILPSERGAGLAMNYYNYVTMIAYGQMMFLAALAGRRSAYG
jgi:hypothetical protein